MRDNDIEAMLRSKLSPEGRQLLAEVERRVEHGDDAATPEDLIGDLLPRLEALSDRDSEIVVRILGARILAQDAQLAEAVAEASETEQLAEAVAEASEAEQLLTAMHRAAELEGVDVRTLTVGEALAILERHGEA
jgi:hypothetical protein